jgi:glycosyltransferase involved in cell wall biosynthesis
MTSDVHYPRTLIVGAHFNEHSGSGTYLGRLFTSWPIDRLATVDGGTLQRPDWRRCQQLYRTGELRFPLQPFSRWLLSGGTQGPVRPSIPCAISTPQAQTVPRMSRVRQLIRSPWPVIRRLTGGGEILFRVEPSQQLLSWVRDFHPQVIYGQCTTLNGVRFLRRMHQLLGIPLVLHFMDDWAETQYRKGWFAKAFRRKFESEFHELVQSADVAIAICQEMAEEYEKRYQRPVLWLPMPVELAGPQSAVRTQWTAGRPFRIRYGGRVGWGIRESLADLARAVYALRKEGADVEFDIAAFEPETLPDICRTRSGVNVQIPGPLTDLPRLQAEADVLLICYDFDPTSFAQARYSMPAKLAPCMASGTPILVYGPAGLPVVEYARREGWGKVVDRRDMTVLQTAVRELMESAVLREQLGQTAKRLAADRHDAKVVSGRFCEMLAKDKKEVLENHV